MQAIEHLQGLEYVANGYMVLALARSANGDDGGAIATAGLELNGRKNPFFEPVLNSREPVSQAHELLGCLYLKQKRYDEAAKHLLAAAPHSEKAKSMVENPDPALSRSLTKVRHLHR